jgi:O-antigen ligase
LLGSGPDTFGIVYPKDTVFKGVTVDKAHNEYLQIAVTLGIPALLVYLFFTAHVLLTGLKAASRMKGENQILLFGLLAICIGYLTQAFFNISVITVAPFFWVILGILYHRSVTFLAELATLPLITSTSNKNVDI